MYNLRELVHNSLGELQNSPKCRQVTRQTAHDTNIIVNLLHEFLDIVNGSRNARKRKNYLHFGGKDTLLISQIKTGV